MALPPGMQTSTPPRRGSMTNDAVNRSGLECLVECPSQLGFRRPVATARGAGAAAHGNPVTCDALRPGIRSSSAPMRVLVAVCAVLSTGSVCSPRSRPANYRNTPFRS